MVTVFGIRHHGPGSSKSLMKALEELAPDCILIEGPPDANDIIHHVQNEELIPPSAILIYNPKDFTQVVYYPFAAFSPEWIAMCYGYEQGINTEFMDLPQSMQFGMANAQLEDKQIDLALISEQEGKDKQHINDPFGYIANLAGYTDSERWWEVYFERSEGNTQTFSTILELMSALREQAPQESSHTLMREAFMRKTIRAKIKKGATNIAIVCGAWHAPVLHHYKSFKASTDNAILKGIKKVKTKATWIPWTYHRLATSSGYGAGVISPAWYELLYNDRNEVTIRWMTKVAHLFRQKDLDASSAHIIEAVRLAETLATIRSLSIAGINELYEAAVTIFSGGYDSQMDLIENELIIGDKVGQVPEEIPMIPLQEDLMKQIKSTRLTQYWNKAEPIWLKASDKFPKGKIDLRIDADLKKSHLLHRLNLLGINWGTLHILKKSSNRSSGNQHESWELHWRPELLIRIIEVGMWGNTVEIAAINFVHTQMSTIHKLPDLTKLIKEAVLADLSAIIPKLSKCFQDLAAVTTDIIHLIDALPELIKLIRYGSVRKANIELIQIEIDKILPRICIGLPNVCMAFNDDASKEMLDRILSTNYFINILNKKEHNQFWIDSLLKITTYKNINAIIRGGCIRILFDKNELTIAQTAKEMSLNLSLGNELAQAANWLEGFLEGSGLLLIHHQKLWNILDEWVKGLSMDGFKLLLPLLRRTFSSFPAPEREQLLRLVKSRELTEQEKRINISYSERRGEKAISTAQLLLGIR